MTYEEFKAKVEELGYFTDTNYFNIRIFDKYKETIAYLRRAVGDIDTFYESFSKLEKSKKIEILDICYQLAKTPLEDREDEKSFIIPLPGLITTDGKQQYLSQDYNFFASRRDKTLKQTWKEEHLKHVPEVYRQFAVELEKGKEY